MINNQIDKIYSIDLMDMSDYRISNKKHCRGLFISIDNIRLLWCIPLKTKYSKTITNDFLKNVKRKPNETQSDRATEFPGNFFQNIL